MLKKNENVSYLKAAKFSFSFDWPNKKNMYVINQGMYIIPKCEGHSLYICPLLPKCLIYKLIIIILFLAITSYSTVRV